MAAVVDYLEEDPELPGKRFAIVSFISPEKVIRNKELWLMSEFRRTYEANLRLKCVESFLGYMSQKYSLRFDAVLAEYEGFQKAHASTPEITYSEMDDQYRTWLDANETRLNAEFDKANEFRTSVRGLKIRDVFGSIEEAKARLKKYTNLDANRLDIYICEVGKWLPFHPEISEIAKAGGSVQYANEQLNELMQKRIENEVQKDAFWQEDRDNKKRLAAAETLKKIEANRAIAELGLD